MKKVIIMAILSIIGVLNLSAKEINLIPQPISVERMSGEFVITEKTSIQYQSGLEKEATYLQELLEASTGFDIETSEGKKIKRAIVLSVDSVRVATTEGYELIVSDNSIVICGADNAGVFYGIQTLLQLFPPEVYNNVTSKDIEFSAPAVAITDAPTFKWRGMMLDVARYFYDKEFVKKYIDMMSMYKLNKLQLHLIDDSGWRLEIKKYPRLTEIGAWGGEGPTRLGGYYTQEDIKEIVAYAAVRNVDVIPEIAFPAHMLCAIVAYPELGCTGIQHEVPIQHFISRDLLCIGNEKSIQFLEDVLEETIALFPSKYINIGGDEAVYANWEKCPKCQAVRKEQGLKKTSELQGYLTNLVSNMMKKHGRTVVGWQEIAQRGKLDNQVVSIAWTNLKYAKDATDKGHFTVLCPASHMYFDFPEGRTPGEPKAATWMPPISVEKCYSLKVGDYGSKELTLGVQGAFWSDIFIHGTTLQEIYSINENRSENYAEYLTFPRLLALSEVGWSVEGERDYDSFTDRLKHHYVKLDNKDCNYRVPEPYISEVEVSEEGVEFTLEESVADAKIVYTTDGTYPNPHSTEYTEPVTVENTSDFKAITIVTNRHVSLPIHIEEKYADFKKYGELSAEWKPKDIKGAEFATWKFEATGKIAGNGTYEITFVYTGGECRLDIEDVKLFKRDELVGEDVHTGYTGGSSKNNTYTVKVDSFEAGTPFFIEANVRGDLSNDSYGAVFIRKVK